MTRAGERSLGFTVEILDDAAAARTRINDLIPEDASVFTGASETLRLSGIDADINTSGRYQAIKPRVLAMDRVTGADDIRRLLASPDVAVGSVAALTETGSGVAAERKVTLRRGAAKVSPKGAMGGREFAQVFLFYGVPVVLAEKPTDIALTCGGSAGSWPRRRVRPSG